MPKEKFSEWPLDDTYGICRQTLLPVYRVPSRESGLRMQLLFGECYQVLAHSGDQAWYRVFHKETKLQGWISTKSFKPIDSRAYAACLEQACQLVTSSLASIRYLKSDCCLLLGSRLHYSERELFDWQSTIRFTGTSRNLVQLSDRNEFIQLALRFDQVPWQAGGRSIFGLDEYLGIPFVYSLAGYFWSIGTLPGKKIDITEAKPGDLLSFQDCEANPPDLAIYLGEDEVLWMKHKMNISSIKNWTEYLEDFYQKSIVVEARTIIRSS